MTTKQFSIPITLALTVLGMILAAVASYYSAQANTSYEISGLEKADVGHEGRIKTLEEKADSNEAWKNRMETKIDTLLINQGINPTKIK